MRVSNRQYAAPSNDEERSVSAAHEELFRRAARMRARMSPEQILSLGSPSIDEGTLRHFETTFPYTVDFNPCETRIALALSEATLAIGSLMADPRNPEGSRPVLVASSACLEREIPTARIAPASYFAGRIARYAMIGKDVAEALWRSMARSIHDGDLVLEDILVRRIDQDRAALAIG